jgi:hypothetical protein
MRTALKIAAFAALMPVLIVRVIGCDEFGKAVKMSKEKQNPQNEAAAADPQPANEQTAYFAAGCFWGVEAAFRRIEGVTGTAVGYMGGHTPNPTYKQVCSNRTGHAETVRVRFDPQKVTYEQLLDVFWSIHDPPQPPGPRRRQPVPLRYLRRQRNTLQGRRRIAPGPDPVRPIRKTHRHRDQEGRSFLPRRRVPPALSRKTGQGRLHHHPAVIAAHWFTHAYQ